MRILVLGMGNPILTDDAVGVRLAADFKAVFGAWRGLEIVEECAVGGLELIEVFRGCQRAIVFDSLETRDGRPGAWHQFTAAALRQTAHLGSIHDANFATALKLGRRLGLPLPADDDIHIFAVEIADNRTFGESMTPALERAYPRLRTAIFTKIRALPPVRRAAPAGQPVYWSVASSNLNPHPPWLS